MHPILLVTTCLARLGYVARTLLRIGYLSGKEIQNHNASSLPIALCSHQHLGFSGTATFLHPPFRCLLQNIHAVIDQFHDRIASVTLQVG